MAMDRLSVALAISRGRRLYHGQPFVVFALDLRDPLGACLTHFLSRLRDSRSVEAVHQHVERRERAPVVVVPSPSEHLKDLAHLLREDGDTAAREGCTAGDLHAAMAFLRGARASHGGVPVFLVAAEERVVYLFPLSRKAWPERLVGLDPLAFGESRDATTDDAPEEADEQESWAGAGEDERRG